MSAASSGDGQRIGTVVLLRRFPLRSARGECPDRVQVEADGVDGDRRWVVAEVSGDVPLTAKQLPALAEVGARLVDGSLVLDAPLADLAPPGQMLEVREAAPGAPPQGRHSGGAAVHLISEGAAEAPGAPAGCDPGERANVVVQLSGDLAPGAERDWVGRTLHLGDDGLRLRVSRTPSTCLGVYADVLASGSVSVGDAVLLGQLTPVTTATMRVPGHDHGEEAGSSS